MEKMEARLLPHIEAASFPDFVFTEVARLGLNGTLTPKKYGGLELTTIEAGAISFELGKVDGSIAMSFLI